jgi:hypothetical protein
MANFNVAKLQKAFVKAGKELLKSILRKVASHGVISVLDPAFGGRFEGDFGPYIRIRNEEGGLMCISTQKGTPKSANSYEIVEFEALEAFEKMAEGDHIFKAVGIVAETDVDEE